MSHLPFEEWLLSDEPLSTEQSQALLAHLKTCLACRELSAAVSQVVHLFRIVPPLAPAAGFVARWQERLAAQELREQERKYWRQSWGFLLSSALIAGVLFLLLAMQFLLVFESPTQLLLAGVYRVTEFYTFINAIQEVLTTLIATLISIVPPTYWAVMAAAIGLLSLLWLFSLHQLILIRRTSL